MKGRSYNLGGAWKAGCEARGSIPDLDVVGVLAAGVETAEIVDDEDDDREQPEDREDPENETFRMCRSRGQRDDLRLWPNPCSTCMFVVVSGG